MIVRILGEHLTSLEWVHENVNELRAQIQDAAAALASSAKAETDRVHRGITESKHLFFT